MDKQKTKKPTVTVATSAYNEEKNILRLLKFYYRIQKN